MAHTEGPWKQGEGTDADRCIVLDNDGNNSRG